MAGGGRGIYHLLRSSRLHSHSTALPVLSSLTPKKDQDASGTKSLRALALLGAGVSGLLSFTTIASADEAEHGLECPSYPWPHEGILSSYDHASIRRGHQVYTQVCASCHSMGLISYAKPLTERKMERAIERQRVLLEHLRPSSTSSSLENLSASVCAAGDSAAYQRNSVFGDDVVIVAAYRSPLCKAKRGGLKDTYPDDILAPVLKALIEKTNINPAEVGDIVVGSVLGAGSQRASECRMAAFYAGFPETVPVRTVNRQCSSGLQAVADVAAAIKAGFYDIGIGAGLESMTANPMAWEGSVNPKVKTMAQAQDCLLPMGITSENVAHKFSITRQEQDQAAVESHRKAAAATAAGRFKDEIIPIKTKIVDPKTGDEKPVTISVDDGIRPGTTLADLAKLKPVFRKDGSTTAGTSSQVSDGAGAVLLMKRSIALQKGLPILGVFRTFAAVGVPPSIMGIGPAVAIPAAVKAAGLQIDDIDLFEINEAFASQFVYCQKKLEIDPQKINVNGGAMAIGHPLGATGARCVATLLHEMKRRGRDCQFGVVSMCIGTGMGAAAVFERGDACDELCYAKAK